MSERTIEFCGTLKSETKACWFVDDGINEIPIAKYQVEKMRRISGDDYEFTIPYWLAKKKGIV